METEAAFGSGAEARTESILEFTRRAETIPGESGGAQGFSTLQTPGCGLLLGLWILPETRSHVSPGSLGYLTVICISGLYPPPSTVSGTS